MLMNAAVSPACLRSNAAAAMSLGLPSGDSGSIAPPKAPVHRVTHGQPTTATTGMLQDDARYLETVLTIAGSCGRTGARAVPSAVAPPATRRAVPGRGGAEFAALVRRESRNCSTLSSTLRRAASSSSITWRTRSAVFAKLDTSTACSIAPARQRGLSSAPFPTRWWLLSPSRRFHCNRSCVHNHVPQRRSGRRTRLER